MTAITLAIEAVGGQQTELARRISVSPQALNQWVQGKRPIPAERCMAIEREAGIRCEDLRSDLTWTRDERGNVTGYHVRLVA